MAVSSYGSATRSSGVVRIMKDLDLDLTGRDVLIVEDIVDSGLTLAYLRKNLAARGPASLEVCALLVKEGLQQRRARPEVRGLHGSRPTSSSATASTSASATATCPTSPSTRARSRPDADGPARGPRSRSAVAGSLAGHFSFSELPVTKLRRSIVIAVVAAAVVGFLASRVIASGSGPEDALARRLPAPPRRRQGRDRDASTTGTTTSRASSPTAPTTRSLPASYPKTITQEIVDADVGDVKTDHQSREPVAEPAVQPAAVRARSRSIFCGARPGAGRRQPGHGLREVARQGRQQGPAEGHVRRRRRARRSGRGARGDQGLPRVAGEVPGDGREDPEGRAAVRPAGHRQDAARQGGRR